MGKGKWERQRVKRLGEGSGRRERPLLRWAGKQRHLLKLVTEERTRSGHKEEEVEVENLRSCGYLKEFHSHGIAHWCSFPQFLCCSFLSVEGVGGGTHLRRGRGITFVSYGGARREEWPIWRGGNEAAVNLFLIDQSLSKGKGKRGKENKHSEMLIWNRHFREQIRLSNYHLCLRMTPLMWMRLRRLSLHSVNNENSN